MYAVLSRTIKLMKTVLDTTITRIRMLVVISYAFTRVNRENAVTEDFGAVHGFVCIFKSLRDYRVGFIYFILFF